MRCEKCDREFKNEHGLKVHNGIKHDPLPEKQCVELYVRRQMSAFEIAQHTGISHRNVKDRLSKYDLWRMQPTKLHLFPDDGYPVVYNTGVTGNGHRLRIHRLIAIAEGADPHKIFSGDWDVHHKNEIKWDNRPENLEVVRHDEHPKIHH